MFRTLRAGLLILLGSAALGSCISPPDFPDTPSIEFKELRLKRSTSSGQPIDTVFVTVGFKDGDGDLGLSAEQYSSNNPPYQRNNADGTLNQNHWNYYFRIFVKNPQTGQFEQRTSRVDGSTFPAEDYYGQYPHLEPENFEKAAPLQGDLTFKQFFGLGDIFLPGDEVRFEVTIKDRALNTSNTVTTSSFVVARP